MHQRVNTRTVNIVNIQDLDGRAMAARWRHYEWIYELSMSMSHVRAAGIGLSTADHYDNQ